MYVVPLRSSSGWHVVGGGVLQVLHLCLSSFFQVVKLLALSTFLRSYVIHFWVDPRELEVEQFGVKLSQTPSLLRTSYARDRHTAREPRQRSKLKEYRSLEREPFIVQSAVFQTGEQANRRTVE